MSLMVVSRVKLSQAASGFLELTSRMYSHTCPCSSHHRQGEEEQQERELVPLRLYLLPKLVRSENGPSWYDSRCGAYRASLVSRRTTQLRLRSRYRCRCQFKAACRLNVLYSVTRRIPLHERRLFGLCESAEHDILDSICSTGASYVHVLALRLHIQCAAVNHIRVCHHVDSVIDRAAKPVAPVPRTGTATHSQDLLLWIA
jgi:hypothetical protein